MLVQFIPYKMQLAWPPRTLHFIARTIHKIKHQEYGEIVDVHKARVIEKCGSKWKMNGASDASKSYDTIKYGEFKAVNSHLFINAQAPIRSWSGSDMCSQPFYSCHCNGDGSDCYWIHFIACLDSKFSHT